jgi:hypothetical protein
VSCCPGSCGSVLQQSHDSITPESAGTSSTVPGYLSETVLPIQSPELHRLVKPPVLSAFGDIALALNGDFEPYMSVSMQMIVQASSTVIPEVLAKFIDVQLFCSSYFLQPDDEMIEYLNQLREGALEAYTGIIQGMKEGGKGVVLFIFPSTQTSGLVCFRAIAFALCRKDCRISSDARS